MCARMRGVRSGHVGVCLCVGVCQGMFGKVLGICGGSGCLSGHKCRALHVCVGVGVGVYVCVRAWKPSPVHPLHSFPNMPSALQLGSPPRTLRPNTPAGE